MNKRIKILQLQTDYHENSHHYSDLGEQVVAAFPRERYDVTSVFFRGGVPEKEHPLSRAEKVIYLDLPSRALGGFRLKLLWWLYLFCRREKFDVVICNRYKQVNLMMLLNRCLKIPVCIGISHSVFGEYESTWRRRRTRMLMAEAWHFVGVSPAVKQHLIKQNCGFTEKNTVAITNAIDIEQVEADQFPREVARERLGLPQTGRIVGAAGRLALVKGHIYLLQAFAQVAQKYPDTALAIIGEGKERSNLEQEITRLGLQGRVHLLGFRAGAKQYVRAFDIWAMPSLSEGLGLALLEGMCGHLPIIASDVPAMRPLVEGAGGVLVKPADVPSLVNALEAYFSLSTTDLQMQGEKAYTYLVKNHGIEQYRFEYRRFVETCLAKAV